MMNDSNPGQLKHRRYRTWNQKHLHSYPSLNQSDTMIHIINLNHDLNRHSIIAILCDQIKFIYTIMINHHSNRLNLMWTDWASDPMGSWDRGLPLCLRLRKVLAFPKAGWRRSQARHPSRHPTNPSTASISKREKNSKKMWSKQLQSFWAETPTKPQFWNPIQNHQQTILKPPEKLQQITSSKKSPTKSTCAKLLEFPGMIPVITINNHPTMWCPQTL